MIIKPPIAAAAAAAAACKVWIRSSGPCFFGRSIYENIKTSNETICDTIEQYVASAQAVVSAPSISYHCDRMLVDFEERVDGSVVLTQSSNDEPDRSKPKSMHQRIPLGRAGDCPTLTQRALQDDAFNRRRRPFVSLAVVGIVVDDGDTTKRSSDGSSPPSPLLLVTRRPSYMRSFPGAFVFPGGNVDTDDESLAHALSREIREETGLELPVDAWKLECLWESIYPTHIPPSQALEDGSDELKGAIKAHHLVCYFSGTLPNQTEQQRQESSRPKDPLKLCEEEVDGAVWLAHDNIRDILRATKQLSSNNGDHGCDPCNDQNVALHATRSMDSKQDTRIPLSDLAGIYPRLNQTEGHFCGIAQGSLFALEEYMKIFQRE